MYEEEADINPCTGCLDYCYKTSNCKSQGACGAELDIRKLVQDLETLKATIEWDYPINYQATIDKTIHILNEKAKELSIDK